MKLYRKVALRYIASKRNIYYWAASEAQPVNPGFKVPVWKPRHPKIEAIFEEVRLEKFPNRPSRLGAKFVCLHKKGFCQKPTGSFFHSVHEVRVKGKVFIADMEYFTEVVMRTGGKVTEENERLVRSFAEDYWSGNIIMSPEVIVQGDVTVLGPA